MPSKTKSLLSALQRLDEADDPHAVLDIKTLPVQEQDAARLFNRLLQKRAEQAAAHPGNGALHQKILENILNGMDALVAVVNPENNHILFLNDSIRKHFAIQGDGVGEVCHVLLQHLDEPCPACPYNMLLSDPEKTVVWEHQEAVKGSILHKTAKLIDWTAGKKAHLEYAVDITATRSMEKNLRKLETEVEKIYYDPLTQIYNRRYFEENIDRICDTLLRSGGTLSLLMIDIDYFKRYNDTYGHIAGDDCLMVVAETLQNCTMRKKDFVARFGGEEFVVVLPNTDASGVRRVADNMLYAIGACNIPHANSSVANHVTVSIGAVSGQVLQPGARGEYLRCADEMLYKSKQSGRNRITYGRL